MREMEHPAIVFIDNSNLWIRGKFAVAELENVGQWRLHRESRELNELRIDYGFLLKTILKGRQMSSVPFIVGSRPPQDDSLWDSWRKQGMEVEVLDRNCQNKEKGVDITLAVEAMEAMFTNPLGVLILVAGDGDYKPLLKKAVKHGWKIEVYFWQHGEYSMKDWRFLKANALSKNQKSVTTSTSEEPATASQKTGFSLSGVADWIRTSEELTYSALEPLYKKFTFASTEGRRGEHKITLETSSNCLKDWTNAYLLELLQSAEVFLWVSWLSETSLRLHFTSADQAIRGRECILKRHPEVQIETWNVA
jgi:uncharacterized LabA/DUF88 family protein